MSSKVEKAINNVIKEITYLCKESANKDSLSVAKQNWEQVISDGWVARRVKKMFQAECFDVKQIEKFFDEHCILLTHQELGHLDFALQGKTAGVMVFNVKLQIVNAKCNLLLSEHLKLLKSPLQSIN
jgi:hypothetical protein